MQRRIGKEDFTFNSDRLWARKRTLFDGLEAGVELIETGSLPGGESRDYLSVVKSKGMGLGDLRFGGLDLFFKSPISSTVSPLLFEPTGMNLLKAVREGLFRAGPFHIGGPEQDHPLHGTAWCTPGQDAWITLYKDEAVITGSLVFRSLFGPLVRIDTETRFNPEMKRVDVTDWVRNESQEVDCPHMYMFHTNCNPLLPKATLLGRFERTEARDARAADGLSRFRELAEPEPLFEEQVYYHWLARDEEGFGTVAIVNEKQDQAISVSYDAQFPILVQWKCLRLDFQVCGLEGSTSKVQGRLVEETEGRRILLNPGETRVYRARISAYTTREEVSALIESFGQEPGRDDDTTKAFI